LSEPPTEVPDSIGKLNVGPTAEIAWNRPSGAMVQSKSCQALVMISSKARRGVWHDSIFTRGKDLDVIEFTDSIRANTLLQDVGSTVRSKSLGYYE